MSPGRPRPENGASPWYPKCSSSSRPPGLEILVERGAGAGAAIPDQAYADAGATVVSTADLYAQSDVILRVQKPSEAEIARTRKGQVVIGLLQPLIDPKSAAALAAEGVTAISLDALPRTLSRAQTMDALSSQANVGGYKAVLIAANAYGRYFPLLTTAAGTAKPANVLILGIGVAGLQAIGTARRLGAVVKAYDVRPETKEQAESLGRDLRRPQDGHRRHGRAATPGSSRPRSRRPSRPSSTASSPAWTSSSPRPRSRAASRRSSSRPRRSGA